MTEHPGDTPLRAATGARPQARAADCPSSAHRSRGLHLIAVIEAVKGSLGLLAGSGLIVAGPAPLQHWLLNFVARFHLDARHGAIGWLLQAITPNSVHVAAAVVFAYGVIHLFEAWGLWRAKSWASWLGCVSAACYLPFDVYALFKHQGWISLAVVVINLIVVWVLARDLVRRRRPAAH